MFGSTSLDIGLNWKERTADEIDNTWADEPGRRQTAGPSYAKAM